MVTFANYDMPVQFEGIMAEHAHTREHAGLFDVSHMGQATLAGPDHATTAALLEKITPGDLHNLAPGRQKYTVLLNEEGGIVDDLMVARPVDADGVLVLVVNASRKSIDFDMIQSHITDGLSLEYHNDQALLALQGPGVADIAHNLSPALSEMNFMQVATVPVLGVDCFVSRSGYTGEDGYEISLPAEDAHDFARKLLEIDGVAPIGLGARDSLRLEAGLPLYGHDIDETTSPVEAGLKFAVSRLRRERGDFPGAQRILAEWRDGPPRLRVGIKIDGRMPAREGTEIQSMAGENIGKITSGGFAPTVGVPIAMGYVSPEFSPVGTPLKLLVRGKELSGEVAALPFVAHRYHR
jgi:aminomethyltransferase